MQIATKQFSPDTIEWFRKACESGHLSRRALAREFCMREQWLDYAGRLNLASASPVLLKLAERLGVSLPQVKGRPLDAHPRPSTDYPDHAVSVTIQQLGTLSLVPVTNREEGRLWESMLETHHPEGWHRAPGGLIQYWIVSSVEGVLGALSFCAATMQLAPRDQLIGWSNEACIANIGQVICNQRFLILPGVRVPKLSSRVLKMAGQQIADDWEAKYRTRPVLVYTFTAPEQGWSYRVARWRACPALTSGRRSGIRRAVWVKPLSSGWREQLCTIPHRALGWSYPVPDEIVDWAEREYDRCCYPDGRVCRRVLPISHK